MKYLLVLPFLLLAGCNSGTDNAPLPGEQGTGAGDVEAADGKVECALAGAESFSRDCTTDRISGANRELLVIKHPDGGFQRFEIVTDGRGLIAADGFDDTQIRLLEGEMIEVTAGDDRYRLPARIQAGSAQQEGAPSQADGSEPDGAPQ